MISMTTRSFLLTGSALGFLFGSTSTGFAADDAAAPAQLPAVSVEATVPPPAEGSTEAGYRVKNADLGPMGSRKVQDTPYSITTIPADLMETQQVRNISDIIKYNPSAQIEPRGDLDFGRPQTRGFENSSTQNTRIDGLNSYTIMAYPMEEYQDLEILNGAAGALYGASSPGGTFNFVSKRPTDTPMQRLTLGYDSLGSFSEHGEASGQVGAFGYRLNALHGQGEGYVSTSSQERELLSANFDVRLNDSTKLELNGSGYKDNENGFPSALVYGSGKIPASAGSGTIPSAGAALASNLPAALDPTKAGYGVVGAGQHLQDEDVSARLIHAFSPDWKLTVGGMYQNVDRTENPSGTYGAADPGNWLMSNGKIATIVGDTGLHTEVDSDIAYLNGHVETGSLTHDLILGTNGYQQTGYNRKGMNYQLGTASLSAPVVYYNPSYSNQGSFSKSSYGGQQALVTGDTVTFNEQWSVLASASQTWLSSVGYNTNGTTSSAYNAYGVSPTGSLIYKPVPNVTTYLTYADALQAGDILPTTSGGSVPLPPYRSTEWELGGKVTLRDSLDLNTALFHMSRPYAYNTSTTVNTVTNYALNTNGEQVNDGIEMMAKGKVSDDLTVFGGVTFIDPMLKNTSDPTTDHKLVVSVPKWQGNVYTEYNIAEVSGLSVNSNVHYTGRRAADVTNTSWAAPYATLDLGTVYKMTSFGHEITWRAGVNNVTNQHYWAAILPETTGGGSSQAGATNTVYEAMMGAPLTFHASVSVDF